jgi:small subunit ribosomal protein S6
MRNYEVTFIVDPVLSGDEIRSTAKTYEDLIKNEGGKIVHLDEMGLKQLAYPINKRSSGVYFCIEFQIDSTDVISKLELSMRRDERIMRFLSIRLDKYGVKYNDDKRQGLIGKRKDSSEKKAAPAAKKSAPKAAPKAAPKPEPKPAPVVVSTEEE